jgi:glutaredoxin
MYINLFTQQESNRFGTFNEKTQITGLNSDKDTGQTAAKNGVFNISNLNAHHDTISERRDQAKLKAMDIILKQNKAVSKVDNIIAKNEENIARNKAIAQADQDAINQIDDEIDAMREDYGVGKDSDEQKNLELYQKYKKSGLTSLTQEEQDQLSRMGPLTEYQQKALSREDGKEIYQNEQAIAAKTIYAESAMIGNIERERLKDQGMIKAVNLKESLVEQADKEAVGDLFQESLTQMEQAREEVAAEDEKIEKERKEETEKANEDIDSSEQSPQVEMDMKKVNEDLEKLRKEMHLTTEDLKGIIVDA